MAFGCFSVNIIVVLLLALPYLTDNGLSRETAAWAIAVASVPAMLSKPVWGYLIDRSPVKPLAAISASICGVALFCIIFAVAAQEIFWIYAAFFLLGTGWGGMIPMQEVIWHRFLVVVISAVFAGLPCRMLGFGCRSALVGVLLSRCDRRICDGALRLLPGLNVLSGVMIFSCRRLNRKDQRNPPQLDTWPSCWIIGTVNRSVVMGITVQPQGAVGAEVAGVDLNHLRRRP